MKIDHLFEGNACVHCGASSASAPMCKLDGKPIAVGEHNVARDPFRSIFDDFDAISERHRELFAPPPPPKTCDLCGSAYVNGQWQSCSGACCD